MERKSRSDCYRPVKFPSMKKWKKILREKIRRDSGSINKQKNDE